MCRAMREGGRRCPCSTGERRRAAARARYAARTAEAARRAANISEFTARWKAAEAHMLAALTADGDSSGAVATAPAALGESPDSRIEQRYASAVVDLTSAERDELRSYATARARASAKSTRAAYSAMAGTHPYTDTPQRRAYEAALQEQGRHLAAVADVELCEALRGATPDDDDRDAPGSSAWAARMIADSGFCHDNGVMMTAREVILAIREGRFDDQAHRRYSTLTTTLNDGRQMVRIRRAEAHAAALRATVARVNPDLTFGSADPAKGSQPVVWGTGMTRAKQRDFTANLHAAYPDRLIEHARDSGRPLRVRVTSSRAHYQPTGAHERIPAAHFIDARELIKSADAVGDGGGVEAVRISQLQTRAGYSTRYTEPRGSLPRVGGVPDTPENRGALESALEAWSDGDNPYYDKRFRSRMGKDPQIVDKNGMLYVTSKKNVGSLPGAPVAELTTNGAQYVTVHEMAHRIEEQTPAIAAACHAFLARRTAGMKPSVYNTSTRRGRRVVELVREDSFVDPYIGRDYGEQQPHTEVFSVGMEALVTGSFGGLTNDPTGGWGEQQRRADPEHRQLVLALLASAPGLITETQA